MSTYWKNVRTRLYRKGQVFILAIQSLEAQHGNKICRSTNGIYRSDLACVLSSRALGYWQNYLAFNYLCQDKEWATRELWLSRSLASVFKVGYLFAQLVSFLHGFSRILFAEHSKMASPVWAVHSTWSGRKVSQMWELVLLISAPSYLVALNYPLFFFWGGGNVYIYIYIHIYIYSCSVHR